LAPEHNETKNQSAFTWVSVLKSQLRR